MWLMVRRSAIPVAYGLVEWVDIPDKFWPLLSDDLIEQISAT
jgi:hypothetical protein